MIGPESAIPRAVTGLAAGAAAIAAVSGLIAVLDIWLDAEGLISLYLIAIVPVAIFWGFRVAAVVALASFLTCEFFFVPPLRSFEIAHGEDVVAIGVSLVVAFLVGELARRARAAEARMRAREAALRRVATLVAQEAPAGTVFAAVAEEVARLLAVDGAAVQRFDGEGGAVVVGNWGFMSEFLPVGTRMDLDGGGVTALVHRTGRPARFDHFEDVAGTLGAGARRAGMRAAVGCPIDVARQPWGAIVAATSRHERMPADAEPRIADFTELVAAAISNVQARSDLSASRARLVAAADQERRRVVRDIHDGAQQRMVQTILTLKLARRALDGDRDEVAPLIDEALEQAELSTKELRDLAHGIMPPVLTRGGLRAAVDTVAVRLDLPVRLDVTPERVAAEIEASAYLIVAEALTNVVKHARAQHAEVKAIVDDGVLQIEVHDDGIGGADPHGHGLTGVSDRVTALGGRLTLDSPPGGGTRVAATFPL